MNPLHTHRLLSGLLLLGMTAAPATSSAQNLIPMPRQVNWHKGSFSLSRPYSVVNESGTKTLNPWLDSICHRSSVTASTSHVVCLRDLRPGTAKMNPEAYRLHITPDSLVVSAAGSEGFIRAAQTLQQLTDRQGRVASVDICDGPAYRWRGLMLDVSRHFFPMSFLKKQVDVMARYKFNRLHLHLTDAAGWRMEIKRYPRLTNFAAWRTDASWKTWWNDGKRHYAHEDSTGAYGGYYTQDELRSLVKYAAERGITIVPEIEMPAHSEEVLTAYPELSCTHVPYKQADFCPGSVATYDFLENVLKEVMDVFPSTEIHVGGDEAGKASWPTCPLCQQKMKELGLQNVDGLQAHLISHMGRFLEAHGRQLVGWDEVIAGNLNRNTTVMVWRGVDKAGEAIRHGYDVVLSPGAYCYLDSYQDAPRTQPEAIGGYLTLEKVYGYVPGEGLTAEEKTHIKGVQGNLWTEYVPTPEHAEYMLYPRALALAEIGWNGTEHKDYGEFRQRALAEVKLLRTEEHVNAFDLSHEVGERKERCTTVKHKALGAKVTYNLPYHEYYAADGDGSLTDGKRGGWANNDGRWQGFIKGKRFDVTLDLGRVEKVKEVSSDFMQACGPEIYYPSAYIVSLSTDGEHFTEVYRHSEKSEKTIQPDIRTYAWKGRPTAARYIRVQALPSDFGGWVFTDEVVVR